MFSQHYGPTLWRKLRQSQAEVYSPQGVEKAVTCCIQWQSGDNVINTVMAAAPVRTVLFCKWIIFIEWLTCETRSRTTFSQRINSVLNIYITNCLLYKGLILTNCLLYKGLILTKILVCKCNPFNVYNRFNAVCDSSLSWWKLPVLLSALNLIFGWHMLFSNMVAW